VEAVNKVTPGLIRTEADELSYSLHVLIRYEIEKMLIEEDLDVEKLPQLWADKYEEYLGVRPENPAGGVTRSAPGYPLVPGILWIFSVLCPGQRLWSPVILSYEGNYGF